MSQRTLKLKIAPVRSAIRDLRSNIRWIAAIAAAWVLYTLASSALIRIWEDWGYWHSCYFTLINMTTVGFGDVTPITQLGKLISGVNSVVGLMLFGAFVASITMALQPSSFGGIAEFIGMSPNGSKDTESPESNEDKVATFLDAVNGLVSLREDSEEKRSSESPNVVDVLIDVRGDVGKSKCVQIHIRTRIG